LRLEIGLFVHRGRSKGDAGNPAKAHAKQKPSPKKRKAKKASQG
jgi:hypothetical protein